MVTVKVLQDGFCIGNQSYKKGSKIDVLPAVADYMVSNGKGEIPKRRTYKRRDMQAEE